MQVQHTLSRELSLFDITMIGVGAMIGAGIFVLTGEAAGTAGPALILSFALNGVVTIFTAMVYAELGSAIPEAGGGYLWVKEGLPGSNAFLAGWMSWFAHAVAGALYALGFGAFLSEFLRLVGMPLGFEFELEKKTFAVLIALLFALINYRGASETGMAGNVITLAKVLVIGIFCLFGLKYMFFSAGGMGTTQLQPFIPDQTGWIGILSAMGLTFIAFEGYEIIVQAGEEVKDPRRNIPKAVFWSLVIVVPIYMLVAFVLIGASRSELLLDALRTTGNPLPEGLTPGSENWKILKHAGELGLARAASQFVPYGALLILGGGLLSTMSALNATTFSSTRVAFAMGRDRNLPDQFGYVSPKTRTPAVALVWTAVLICLMVSFVPLTTVAAAADIMFLLLFLQVNVAVLTIRKKYGKTLAYGYLAPFFPIVPLAGIVTKLGLALFMFDHYPVAWVYVIFWLLAGTLIFRFYASERERSKEAPPVLVEERGLQVKPHSVVVAVANPETAKQHVQLAARVAGKMDSELVLLHAVRVPRQLPQRAAAPFVAQGRAVLEQVREFVEGMDVPISMIIRTGADVSKAVLHTAQDKNADYIVMGWQGPRYRGKTQIGKNIDRVLMQSNCHAIIVTRTRLDAVKRILIPIANPRNAGLALWVGSLLIEGRSSCRVVMLHLSPRPLTQQEQEEFRSDLLQFAGDASEQLRPWFTESRPGAPFQLEFAVAGDVVGEVTRRSAEYDRLIIGTSPGGLWGRRVFGQIPTRIANRSRCPVILVRARETGLKFEIQQFVQFFKELEQDTPSG